MNDDGSCPRCGANLDEPAIAAGHRPGADERATTGDSATTDDRAPTDDSVVTDDSVGTDDSDAKDERTPWHFKLMIVALVVYLGWRFIEIGVKIFT